jgi:hypothetical protein
MIDASVVARTTDNNDGILLKLLDGMFIYVKWNSFGLRLLVDFRTLEHGLS